MLSRGGGNEHSIEEYRVELIDRSVLTDTSGWIHQPIMERDWGGDPKEMNQKERGVDLSYYCGHGTHRSSSIVFLVVYPATID